MDDVSITFFENLQKLLKVSADESGLVKYVLTRSASIKDIVESLGVPHTEIGELRVNSREVSFGYLVENRDEIEVRPQVPPVDVLSSTILRPTPLEGHRFLVDVNVAKLAPLLRMAGFDTRYENHLRDAELAEIAAGEKRILLTRDRALLKRKQVEFGHLILAIMPDKQLAEVIDFYGLRDKVQPFIRCMVCNGLLASVDKKDILHRLEPLTKKYYDSFQICSSCDKIYWQGTHKDNMQKYFSLLFQEL